MKPLFKAICVLLSGGLFNTILIILGLFACTVHAREIPNWAQRKPVTFEKLQSGFAEPDMMYGPFTFWFWDEPLNPGKAAHMAQKMTQQRLNPGYAHARMNQAGLEDLPQEQWLSPLWFEAFEGVLNNAQQANSYFGYVDEYWWPSGRAACVYRVWRDGTLPHVRRSCGCRPMRRRDRRRRP